MSESNENKKCGDCDCGPGMAFLVLRLWLGVRALLAGIEKFGVYQSVAKPVIDPATGQPDASGVMINVNVKHYAFANYSGIPAALKDKFAYEPLLPKFALTAFDHLLGPLFIITGVMLLVGLGTRLSLFVQALLYLALTVGLILIDKPDGIAYLGIHVAMVAFALVLVKYNKFALLKKW
jgi:thiosulfate dehydrogenase [quinone] large subunit